MQTLSENITLSEFLQLPEIKPVREYIDGQIFQKPMPQGKHSAIQAELLFMLNQTVKPPKIARAFPELRCSFGDRSIVPDLSVFLWGRIPRDPNGEIANSFALAPDWTIEILSPAQSQTQVTKNILHCLKHGTEMGWLIDPAEQTVFIYQSGKDIEVFDSSDQILPMPSFAKTLSLTIQDFFACLWE